MKPDLFDRITWAVFGKKYDFDTLGRVRRAVVDSVKVLVAEATSEAVAVALAEERAALLSIAIQNCCFNADYRAIEKAVHARGSVAPSGENSVGA
jgi:hypothetical protein